MEIVLIRHGRTASNDAKRYLGRSDEPLSRGGREQAHVLFSSGLPRVERVFSSPLKRCLETAAIRSIPEAAAVMRKKPVRHLARSSVCVSPPGIALVPPEASHAV